MVLHERVQAGQTIGLDSSEAMLERATADHKDVPGLSFAAGDIATWLGEDLDLVFANASLQWIDDHLDLLARMRTALKVGGQLAFQVPANFRHPSHVLARQVALEAPFIDALDGDVPEDRVASSSRPSSTPIFSMSWEPATRSCGWRCTATNWRRPMRWSSGSWGRFSTAHRSRLSAETFSDFVDRYRECLLEELGEREPYFYGFRRILCWARFD